MARPERVPGEEQFHVATTFTAAELKTVKLMAAATGRTLAGFCRDVVLWYVKHKAFIRPIGKGGRR